MLLWNIIPSQPIAIRDRDEDAVRAFAENVTLFFKKYFELNHIDQFTISKLEISERSQNESLRVGGAVTRKDLGEIVRRAVYDEIYVIARGDGCRFFSFGYDYDAWICVKYSDEEPIETPGLSISDISESLIRTDWYDN